MPAPTNISFVTATDIGSLPASITQNVNDSGTTYTVYYKETVAADGNRAVLAFGDLTTYIAEIHIFEDSDLVNDWLGLTTTPVNNLPILYPVRAGHVYYYKIISNGGNVTPAILHLSVQGDMTNSPSNDDLLIINDLTGTINGTSNELPLPAVITAHTSGVVNKTLYGVQPSEMAVMLPNGFLGILYDIDDKLHIWDTSTWTETSVVDVWPGKNIGTQGTGCLGCNHSDSFYVGCNTGGSGSKVAFKVVSYLGVIGGTTYDTGVTTVNLAACDVAQDNSILYYGAYNGSTFPIKRWNIPGNSTLADLVAGQANPYAIEDIKCMANGNILTLWYKSAQTLVIDYTSAGAASHTIDLTNANLGITPRFDLASDEPNSFWIMLHNADVDDNQINIYRNVLISDGSTISEVSTIQFEGCIALYDSSAITASPIRYGPSFSCPLVVMRGVAPSNVAGGIYVQTGTGTVPSITHDELFSGTSTTTTISTMIPSPNVIIYPAGD